MPALEYPPVPQLRIEGVLNDPDTPGEHHVAGRWTALRLRISGWSGGPLQILGVDVDPELRDDVEIDRDAIHPFELQPEEEAVLSVVFRVGRPMQLDLAQLHVQVLEWDDPIPLPSQLLTLHPELRGVEVSAEVLCKYDGDHAQVGLRLDYEGALTLEDAELLIDETAVVVGRCRVALGLLCPKDVRELELVVAQPQIRGTVRGWVEGLECVQSFSVEVPPLPTFAERQFRFLAPHRLVQEGVEVFDAELGTSVPAVGGERTLEGGRTYRVEITPRRSGVEEVRLREVRGVLDVRDVESGWVGDQPSWSFTVQVASPSPVFSRSERLIYEVDRGEEVLKGDLWARVTPRWTHRAWQAVALGAAVTLQGLYGLLEAGWSQGPTAPLDWLGVACIPLVWVGLKALDAGRNAL